MHLSTRILLSAIILGGCAKGGAGTLPGPDPTPTAPASVWRTPVVPGAIWGRFPAAESAGFRSSALDSAAAYLRTLNTTGAIVTAYGRILLEHGDVSEVSYLAGARISVLSMLFGKYVDDGTIKLDATLASMGIDDRLGLLESEKRATVRHLLLGRSGVFHPSSGTGDDLDQAPPRGTWAPGSYFLFNNWDFNALGTILEQKTNQDVYDLLENDLARPIGMEDFQRAAQRKTGETNRSMYLAAHFYLSTRDMARLGELMLRNGRWGDQQVIPASWVRQSTNPVTMSSEMNPPSAREYRQGFGYLWWTFEEPGGSLLSGAYAARGAFGQYIVVIPRLDMVVAHKRTLRTGQSDPVTWPQFLEFLRQLMGARCTPACS